MAGGGQRGEVVEARVLAAQVGAIERRLLAPVRAAAVRARERLAHLEERREARHGKRRDDERMYRQRVRNYRNTGIWDEAWGGKAVMHFADERDEGRDCGLVIARAGVGDQTLDDGDGGGSEG